MSSEAISKLPGSVQKLIQSAPGTTDEQSVDEWLTKISDGSLLKGDSMKVTLHAQSVIDLLILVLLKVSRRGADLQNVSNRKPAIGGRRRAIRDIASDNCTRWYLRYLMHPLTGVL